MKWVLASAAVVAVAGVADGALAAGKAKFGSWGYDASSMDASVKPGDDFFKYVNGGWDKRTQIAPDRTSAGVDVVLTDDAERDVRKIVEDLAKDPTKAGPGGQRVGDFYAAWMDEKGIEARGTAPLKPYLARIAAAKTKADVAKLFAEPGFESPVNVGINPDLDNPNVYVVGLDQSGLGMPNRDYYLREGAKYDGFRKAYRDYVIKVQTLAGIKNATAKADAIIGLERRIAQAHWAPEDTRDIEKINNPMTLEKLSATAPQFPWAAMFAHTGLGAPKKVLVSEPSEVKAAGDLLASTPLSVWKDYLAYHFIRTHAAYLPHAFDQANFDFFSHTLRDVPQQRERWKRGVQLVNRSLGEEVGRIYVAEHFPPEAERQTGELIANLTAAYGERFQKAEWMDEATRKAALVKLATFDPRLGHPKKYIDYSTLKISRADLLGDMVRAETFGWDLQLSRYPKPVDKGLWEMVPQEVNAYYNPLANQITFPAAILQPPYFDPNADPAANYGGEGAVIGHEMGHGFDDEGRHFDETGKVRDWWTADAAKAFGARAAVLGAQFDGYEPVPGVHINGKLTMGENLGDLGGLEAAYAAWRRYVAQHGEPAVIDGFTGDQRFFIAYAQSWQDKVREGALRQQLLTNPHSPAEYRVNGIVRNVDAWYAAFNVKPGDKLYLPPEKRVHVW
ncbi:MAG TPA: M13 family metallopeptidase [Phenylobacterium sp.]|jgi:putative endopeptidase|uniref:M13 family metallopeptidase n=1 Tax=Phenylobacterium sp. TaxID=1871053 RepID=UPI002C1C8BE7|nr:M13 family metallopeptidase [Phenylobacterium sp.]HXA38904.1 M13 family metallopeptidase [Phenylobacterium sp.]